MLPSDLHDLARRNAGVFRLSDARASKVSSQQIWCAIRDGEVVRLLDGVFRFAAAPDSWESRARAATWIGGELCGLSHRTAAHVYDLPGRSSAPIEVICRRWDRAQTVGVNVHEFSGLEPADLTTRDGLPVVVAELAALQLAAHRWVSIDTVERGIYSLRRRGLLSNGSLQEYLYRRARRGRPGVRKLRAALERSWEHSRPTASDMETLLVQTLRRHALPEPILQFEITDAQGRLVARTDAALTGWPIVLEYDSNLHHTDVEDVARDNRRRLWAAEYGFWVITVRAADLHDGGRQLVAAVRGAMRTLSNQPA